MEHTSIGSKVWVIPEGYIPGESTGPQPAMTSHETFCVLNTGVVAAELDITIYFSDRDPVGPYHLTVPAHRTRHVRFNDLQKPEPVPKDTDYSSVIVSDQPIVVQHTRLDSREPANALLSTIAYPVPGQ
ncbi:MAG: sensory rhodopsin transducer [Actinobacteria bacterium]|nr:sensory rhodopsin transducer [Actinomycetota bacterium]